MRTAKTFRPPDSRGLLVILIALIGSSCLNSEPAADSPATTPNTDTSAPWAVEAQVWTDALVSLTSEQGGAAYEFFWSPEVTWDIRPMVAQIDVMETYTARSLMQRINPPDSGATNHEGQFINVEGVVFLNLLDWSKSGNDDTSFTEVPAHLANILGPIGLNGAEHMVSAMTTEAWNERRSPLDEALEAEQIADRWISFWSDSPRLPAGSIYATNALINDSIAGHQIAGVEAIEHWEATQSFIWSVASVGGQAAIYPLSQVPGVLSGAVLVVEGENGSGCPGRTAVVLQLAQGRIVHEERFWDIEQARRCLDPSVLPDGWWIGRKLDFDHPPIPVEDLETVTGSVLVGNTLAEIRNGTTTLDVLVSWAGSRFDLAGLHPPKITSVTFTRYSPYCDAALGRASWSDTSWDVFLCFSERDLCSGPDCQALATAPKHTLLHEFAHPWLAQNLDDADKEDFLDFVGLNEWSEPDIPWEEHGQEHAAEVLAWGLMDTEEVLHRIGRPTPEFVAEAFVLLTGVNPLQEPAVP